MQHVQRADISGAVLRPACTRAFASDARATTVAHKRPQQRSARDMRQRLMIYAAPSEHKAQMYAELRGSCSDVCMWNAF